MVAIVACDKKCISPVNVSALPYKAITLFMKIKFTPIYNLYIGEMPF